MPSGRNAGKSAADIFKASFTESDTAACWEWNKKLFKNNYGCFYYRGRYLLAHRVAYEFFYGIDAPTGAVVMHACDNRRCVNPAHLSLGTHADNIRDMVSKGRANPPKGEAHFRLKISDEGVKEIVARRANGELCKDLAIEFGVSAKTISVLSRGVQRPVKANVAHGCDRFDPERANNRDVAAEQAAMAR